MNAQVLGFRCRVLRIEAIANVPEDAHEVHWALTTGDPDTPELIYVTGHMIVTANGNWGQVIVLGELHVSADRGGLPVVEFLEAYCRGFTAEMYTTARRALAVNAVALDADFAIPPEPPEIDWSEAEIMPPHLPLE